jgi:hypothetical protein
MFHRVLAAVAFHHYGYCIPMLSLLLLLLLSLLLSPLLLSLLLPPQPVRGMHHTCRKP